MLETTGIEATGEVFEIIMIKMTRTVNNMINATIFL